jgi:hypothetical protein
MPAEVERRLLSTYLQALTPLLLARGFAPPSAQSLRTSLDVAFADLGRYMAVGGWQKRPDITGPLMARTRRLLDRLDDGLQLADADAYLVAIFARLPHHASPPAAARP